MTSFRLLAIFTVLALAVAVQAEMPAAPKDSKPADSPAQEQRHSFLDPITFVGESILHPKDPYQTVPGNDPNGWSLVIEPYLWALGVAGDVGVKGLPPVHANFKPKTVLQNLDWGIMGKVELRKGRWGLLGDGLFAQLSMDGNPPGPLYSSGFVKVQKGTASLALAYRIVDDRRGFLDVYAGARYNYMGFQVGGNVDSDGVQRLSDAITSRLTSAIIGRIDNFIRTNPGVLDSDIVNNVRQNLAQRLLTRAVGAANDLRESLSPRDIARILNRVRNRPDDTRELLLAIAQARLAAAKDQLTPVIKNRLNAAQQRFSNALARRIEDALPTSVRGSQSWVDPIVGLRGQLNLTRWLFLAAQGDVGGFGAGSKIVWNAQASMGVNFTRNVFAELGYRYVYMNYSHAGALFNAAEAGVFSGIGVKF